MGNLKTQQIPLFYPGKGREEEEEKEKKRRSGRRKKGQRRTKGREEKRRERWDQMELIPLHQSPRQKLIPLAGWAGR